MHNNSHYELLLKELLDAGFNLVAANRVGDLPESVRQTLPTFGRVSAPEQTLLLVASGGTALWDAMNRHHSGAPTAESATDDPIDRYSATTLASCLDRFTTSADRALLYPTEPGVAAELYTGARPVSHVSLQQLGTLAGWHQPSPMGIGIHRTFGLWFAYRALVLIDWPSDESSVKSATYATESEDDLVCKNCKTLDCVTHCPAGAVTEQGLPDMQACSDYRVSENSACQTQCLARMSCPVGQSVRYHDPQIKYHYSISLESIKERLKNAG